MYIMRSDKGLMVAQISNLFALRMIQTAKGHFDSKGNFVFDEDSKITIPFLGEEITIYFWEGYYLKPKK